MYNLCVTSLHSHITLLNCNHYKFTLISHIPCYTYANTYYHSFLHYSLPSLIYTYYQCLTSYLHVYSYTLSQYIPFLIPYLLYILISYSHNYIFHSFHICILLFVIFYFHIFSFYIFTHFSLHFYFILSSHIHIYITSSHSIFIYVLIPLYIFHTHTICISIHSVTLTNTT